MPFHQHRLPNGLTIIGETSPAARSVALGFFVRTGARDETSSEAGVSHFLEHMMFKGTPRRTAEDVNLDFDRIGASYNAYTSEENTVYYAAVLPEYLPKAMDILADILRPSLRQADFDTEKKVILEEIGMYEDQPGSVAWEHAQRLYYTAHPLGNSVLGTSQSVGDLSRDQMQRYFDRRYAANNIVLAVAGNFDWKRLVNLAGEACASWNTADVGRENRTEWTGTPALHVLTREKVQQEYVLILTGGPPADSQDALRGRHDGAGRRRRLRQPALLGPRRSRLRGNRRLQLLRERRQRLRLYFVQLRAGTSRAEPRYRA